MDKEEKRIYKKQRREIKRKRRRTIGLGILGLIVLIIIISALGGDDGAPVTQDPPNPSTPNVADPLPVDVDDEPEEDNAPESISNFYELLVFELGTNIDDAIEEFGAPTSEMTAEVMGTESTTLSWWTHSGWRRLATSITVTFTDGVATSVLETAEHSSVFTSADAESITTGISETEVYNILGVPYSITHMYMNFIGYSTIVSWIDAQFNSVTVTFTDGVVSSVVRM